MSIIKVALISLLAVYVLFGLLIYTFQESLIFLPEELPKNFEFSFDHDFEEVFLERPDGASINALHFKTENFRGLIVYFHGNAGNLDRWGDVVDPFVDMGFDVLIMDYRGYGKSTGDRSEKAMLADADALYEYALQLVDEEYLTIYGRSIGSAFASHLAGKQDPARLILEAPFYSLPDMAKHLFPVYPAQVLLRFNFKNHRSLQNATCPIFIFHGTQDEVVPFDSGQKLFNSLTIEQKEFIVVDGGGHNNLVAFETYQTEILRILNE